MNKLMEFDLFFCVILPSSAPTPTQLGAELALTSFSTPTIRPTTHPPTHPSAGKVVRRAPIKKVFNKMFLAFTNESKTAFENRKWNHPTRKWIYFSYFILLQKCCKTICEKLSNCGPFAEGFLSKMGPC